jgi:hypothetical protein
MSSLGNKIGSWVQSCILDGAIIQGCLQHWCKEWEQYNLILYQKKQFIKNGKLLGNVQ